MNLNSVLPEALQNSRPVKVLERSLEKNRLAHGILFHGKDLSALESIAEALATVLLEPTTRVSHHPDYFLLRPTNKMRQISAENTRTLIRNIQHSSTQGSRKVAVILEADRMHTSAANIFLKTLEEPPLNTTILLLSTRPYNLLPTIRSRTFNFYIHSPSTDIQAEVWQGWISDYKKWIEKLQEGVKSPQEIALSVMALYGFIARFQSILAELSDATFKEQKEHLPDTTTEEQKLAIEAGVKRSIRQRLFTEIGEATRIGALNNSEYTDSHARKLGQAIAELEHYTSMLVLNLNEAVALEQFLLSSLRIWTSK